MLRLAVRVRPSALLLVLKSRRCDFAPMPQMRMVASTSITRVRVSHIKQLAPRGPCVSNVVTAPLAQLDRAPVS